MPNSQQTIFQAVTGSLSELADDLQHNCIFIKQQLHTFHYFLSGATQSCEQGYFYKFFFICTIETHSAFDTIITLLPKYFAKGENHETR
jgi:hypothetical protein